MKVISHSNLFYWWPVWAAGFILGLVSWFDGGRMAVLPPHVGTGKDRQKYEVAVDTHQDEWWVASASKEEDGKYNFAPKHLARC